MFAPGRTSNKSTGREDDQVKKNTIDELSRGELVLPPSLYTAQALCLLSMHEFLATEEIPPRGATLSNTSDSELGSESSGLSSRGERFRELALQMIQALGIHKPQYPLLTPVPSQAFIEESIEKECVRWVFLRDFRVSNTEVASLTGGYFGSYIYRTLCAEYTVG